MDNVFLQEMVTDSSASLGPYYGQQKALVFHCTFLAVPAVCFCICYLFGVLELELGVESSSKQVELQMGRLFWQMYGLNAGTVRTSMLSCCSSPFAPAKGLLTDP